MKLLLQNIFFRKELILIQKLMKDSLHFSLHAKMIARQLLIFLLKMEQTSTARTKWTILFFSSFDINKPRFSLLAEKNQLIWSKNLSKATSILMKWQHHAILKFLFDFKLLGKYLSSFWIFSSSWSMWKRQFGNCKNLIWKWSWY